MPSFAEHLLSLFASREQSAEIAGDLHELARGRARGWYTWELLRVLLAFGARSLVTAPGRAFCLAGLGLAVHVTVLVVLLAASGLPWYPWHRVNEPAFWLLVGAVAFVANFLTGTILACGPSIRGTRAIAPLMALWIVLWWVKLLVLLFAALRGFVPPPTVARTYWMIGLAPFIEPFLAWLPLLLGAVLFERRAARTARSRRQSA